jgi:hypothetical protein
MPSHDRLLRFSQMEKDGAQLRTHFASLTSAHGYFQGPAGLKSISVSDAFEDGSIEAVFMGVRIKFQLLLIFSDTFEPRGRVVCMHCHDMYGHPMQANVGAFTFDYEGITDLDTCVDGEPITLRSGAPHIVLTFLERAFAANRSL